MVNVERLKRYAEETSGNVDNFARSLGMNAATFYRKLQSHGDKFTIGEVHRMMEQVNMPKETAISIFFS